MHNQSVNPATNQLLRAFEEQNVSRLMPKPSRTLWAVSPIQVAVQATLKTTIKAPTYSTRTPERLNGFQQIAMHVGGMARAVVRHYPVNWAFHWRGICRAVSSEWLLARKCLNG